MKIATAFILALSLLLPTTLPATPVASPAKKTTTADPFRIKKGALIEIDSYDSASDTFDVIIQKESGVGPNTTTPEDLVGALGLDLSVAAFKKAKKDYIGAEFTLIRELPLLRMHEIEARKKRAR